MVRLVLPNVAQVALFAALLVLCSARTDEPGRVIGIDLGTTYSWWVPIVFLTIFFIISYAVSHANANLTLVRGRSKITLLY